MVGMRSMGRLSLLLVGVAAGCGDAGGGTASASGTSTGDDGGAQTSTTQQPTSTSEGDSQSSTTGGGGNSESITGTSTGDASATTVTTTTSTSVATSDDTTDATGTTGTTAEITVSASDTGTGAGDTTGEPGTTGGTTGDGDTSTGPGCIPSPEVCNDVDDDCDEQIDNVDVGMDGICDCLSIALIGNQGANPSSAFQTWLEDQGTTVARISTQADEVLDAATLAKYDIVILDYLIRTYTPEEQAALQTWVEAGGGLMSMTGFADVQPIADRPNSLITPMGLGYNTSKSFFNGPITTFLPHEITMGLTSVSFYGGLFIDIADNIGVSKTIMTLPQGPVGVVQERLAGHIFIFGDEWIEFDSEWQNIPQIQQLWVQTLAWLGPKESCQVPQ